jgi:RNase P/RNase MRP subunit POP5
MLKLKSSARESKRYILLKGNKSEVEKAILDFIGILGYSKAAPYWVIDRKKIGNGNLILSVNRKEIDKIKASFAISADKIEVLKVSGTLKGLGKK